MSTQHPADLPKPCPFCGGVNIIENGFAMFCYGCGAEGPDAGKKDSPALVEKWNARAALAQAQPSLTDEQIWKNDAIMAANADAGLPFDKLAKIVRAAIATQAAQPEHKLLGYLSEHNIEESSPYRWQFSKTSQGVYRDNAIRVLAVYEDGAAQPVQAQGVPEDVKRAQIIEKAAQSFKNDTTHLGQRVYVNDLVWALGVLAAAPQAGQAAGLSPMQDPKYTVNGSAIINRASGEAIPADEPVFILRARDKWASGLIGDYLSFCEDPQHRAAVEARFIQFGDWAESHPERMKEPDTSPAPQAAPQQAEPNSPAPDAGQIIKLGSYGSAFDLAGDRRAYTYKHQPNNVTAWQIGDASSRAEAGGDLIDRGLSLLKALEAQGFGVFDLAGIGTKGAK